MYFFLLTHYERQQKIKEFNYRSWLFRNSKIQNIEDCIDYDNIVSHFY